MLLRLRVRLVKSSRRQGLAEGDIGRMLGLRTESWSRVPHASMSLGSSSVRVRSMRIEASSIVGGTLYSCRSAIFCIVLRRTLPDRVFGRRSTITARLKSATGPIWSRTSWIVSLMIVLGRAFDPGLEHEEPERDLPLDRVGHADHGALGHVRM